MNWFELLNDGSLNNLEAKIIRKTVTNVQKRYKNCVRNTISTTQRQLANWKKKQRKTILTYLPPLHIWWKILFLCFPFCNYDSVVVFQPCLCPFASLHVHLIIIPLTILRWRHFLLLWLHLKLKLEFESSKFE